MSPHEAYFGTKPKTSHLRAFGCPTYVHDHAHSGVKVRATKGYLLGPSTQHADGVYDVWMPKTKTVRQSMDVTFHYPDMPDNATLAADTIELDLLPTSTIEPTNVPATRPKARPAISRSLFTAPTPPPVKAGRSASADRPTPAYFDDNDVLVPGPGLARLRKPYMIQRILLVSNKKCVESIGMMVPLANSKW